MNLDTFIDENMERFIKEYYKDKYSEYEPQRLFLRTPYFLIVEDDLSYKPLWEFILKKFNSKAKFDWAENAEEAEEKIYQARTGTRFYDLIISDIYLPGTKSGLDLWHQYGEYYNNMILVSGMDYTNFLNKLSEETYVPPYLKKPLDVQESLRAINKSLLVSYF